MDTIEKFIDTVCSRPMPTKIFISYKRSESSAFALLVLARWQDIPSEIVSAIGRKHAIKVFEESALGYNTTKVELLNQFEITP